MKTSSPAPHPYHYWEDKNLIQHLIDWALPIGLFLLYFLFYNFGELTSSEMIKTTGLLAISLLSITLFVGPASRFVPALNYLKAHRKFWGVSSFIFVVIHAGLVLAVYFQFDIVRLFAPENPKFFGLLAGIAAFLVLFVITVTSNGRIIARLNPHVWKAIQTLSYLVLILAVAHFYLMEQQDGVLVIRRLLGKVTYWFAMMVVFVRFLVFLLPKKQQ